MNHIEFQIIIFKVELNQIANIYFNSYFYFIFENILIFIYTIYYINIFLTFLIIVISFLKKNNTY
jgi:hypothetical protein